MGATISHWSIRFYYRATLCWARYMLRQFCLSVPLFVCPSVRHTRVLYQNGWTYVSSNFPAFSWVLSLWLAGWLVVSRVCRVSVRAINRSTSPTASETVPLRYWWPHERRVTLPHLLASNIHRAFAICIDSIPSSKLGPARTRPRVLSLSDRSIILVFGHQTSLRKSDGFTRNWSAEYKGVIAIFVQYAAISPKR